MHVVQHIEGRDLLFRLAVSEAELSQMVTAKVNGVLAEAREKGLPILDFSPSVKTRESLITKLLAKKENVAAQVYDKTRFRIVTPTRADILPVLYFLTQRLFPFNFLVPGQTENTLLPFKSAPARVPALPGARPRAAPRPGLRGPRGHGRQRVQRERLPGAQLRGGRPAAARRVASRRRSSTGASARGGSAIGLVEFQMLDVRTAELNEQGENAHVRYKHRQKLRVLRRLSRGLVVPRLEDAAQGEAE